MYRKLCVIGIILVGVFILCSCGNSKVAGDWYSTDNPDRRMNFMTNGTFLDAGDNTGEYSVENDQVAIMYNDGSSAVFYFSTEEGHECLIDEYDVIWFHDYDVALAYYEEYIYSQLEEYRQNLAGTWIDLYSFDMIRNNNWTEAKHTLTINEDGTYSIVYYGEEIVESGEWSLEEGGSALTVNATGKYTTPVKLYGTFGNSDTAAGTELEYSLLDGSHVGYEEYYGKYKMYAGHTDWYKYNEE